MTTPSKYRDHAEEIAAARKWADDYGHGETRLLDAHEIDAAMQGYPGPQTWLDQQPQTDRQLFIAVLVVTGFALGAAICSWVAL